jgi:branched-chain amino acid transport system substrate-binding protein
MTGTLALLGGEVQDGAEAAVRLINEAGGVLGQQIALQSADDACAEDRAADVANQLVGAGVVFVVGHLCSVAAIAAAEVYAANGIVDIAPGAPDPRFTEDRPGDGIFRLFGREDEQGPTAAAFLVSQPANQRIAVIDDSSPYGGRLADSVTEAMGAAGRAPDLVTSYSVANPDFPGLVRQLKTAGIDVVFVAGTADDTANLRLEMASQDYHPLLMGGDTLASELYADPAGAEADGTLFTYQPDPAANPAAAPAIAAITADGGHADGFALYAFAAVEVWAAAVEAAGTTDYEAVAAAIVAGTFDTALGTLGFDAIGDVTLPGWAIYQWNNGEYEIFTP